MRTVLLFATLAAVVAPVQGRPISFDGNVPRQPPGGWICDKTGE
jgi:hypothetical protein